MSAEPTVFVCTLCGDRFTHGGQVCGACPISSACDLIRCPHCGFQFPRRSQVAEWFQRLFRRRVA